MFGIGVHDASCEERHPYARHVFARTGGKSSASLSRAI
jgi:hypothetical protein